MSEIDEIRQRYKYRDTATGAMPRRWDRFAQLAVQERQSLLFDALVRRFSDRDLRSLTTLDIGCGAGGNLLHFLQLGFEPENIMGIELASHRAAEARRRLPEAVRILEGDAATLDLPDESFDIVQQWTVFTSILSGSVQEALARRMWGLLRSGGIIVWYDFVYDNPKNKDVRGVPLPRLRALFPEGQIETRRVTLAPPIGRPAVRFRPHLYGVLNAIPLLRSHLLVTIAKDA